MEIREVKKSVSFSGIVGALLWLLVLVPVAVIFFGIYGLLGAIVIALIARAMKPKKFIVVEPPNHR